MITAYDFMMDRSSTWWLASIKMETGSLQSAKGSDDKAEA